MPEPHAPVEDPEPDNVSTPDHSRPRSPFVDAAALVGGALFGAGSAFLFFRLSLSWPGFGPARLFAAYDALVGGSLGYCLGVRVVLGVVGAGSVMGSRFLPVVGTAYLGALARLVLVRFVPAPLSLFSLTFPFVGGLFGYLLSPGREQGSASGASSRGTSPQPVALLRLVDLSLSGLAGGVVGAVVLGLVGVRVGAAFIRGEVEGFGEAWGLLLFILGAVLGLPLGIAAGLRVAGTKLGIRGRFWPALGASYTGILAWLGLLVLLQHLMNRTHIPTAVVHYQPFLLYAGPFVLSLAGGLIGYLGWSETRRRVPTPLLHWLRLLLLSAAGLAGALVAGRVASLVAVSILRGPAVERLNLFALRLISNSDTYVGMLGYPVGAAAGLGLTGVWFRLRGRFWPALGGACAGLFAAFMLVRFSLDASIRETLQGWTVRRYVEAVPQFCLILSLAGGLAAYLVSRRTRRSYPWWLVAGVLFVTLTAAPALSIIKGRTSLPFTIRPWTARPRLPAFLRYPGAVATTRPLNYYTVTCIEYSFQTTDSPATVVAFYRKALAEWEEERAPGPQDGNAIFYRSRDGKQRVSGWVIRTGPGDSAMTSLTLLYQRGGRGVIVPAHP